MSQATHILLHCRPSNCVVGLPQLRRQLRAARIPALRDLIEGYRTVEKWGRRWGGNKYPELELFAAAYDQLDMDRFMRIALEAPWRYPRDVQLFVRRPGEVKFTVYEIVRGEWRMLRQTRRRRASPVAADVSSSAEEVDDA